MVLWIQFCSCLFLFFYGFFLLYFSTPWFLFSCPTVVWLCTSSCSVVLLFSDSLGLWFYDSLVLQFSSSLVLFFSRSLVLQFYGSLVFRFCFSVLLVVCFASPLVLSFPLFYSSIVHYFSDSRFLRSMVLRFSCYGSLVLRFYGAMVL